MTAHYFNYPPLCSRDRGMFWNVCLHAVEEWNGVRALATIRNTPAHDLTLSSPAACATPPEMVPVLKINKSPILARA